MNQSEIVTKVYTDIKSAVGASVGNRIYNIEGPQDMDLPAIIFQVVADTFIFDMQKDETDLDFQVVVFGYKRLGAAVLRTINDNLVAALHRTSITGGSFVNSFYKNTIKGIPSTTPDDNLEIRSEYNIYSAS